MSTIRRAPFSSATALLTEYVNIRTCIRATAKWRLTKNRNNLLEFGVIPLARVSRTASDDEGGLEKASLGSKGFIIDVTSLGMHSEKIQQEA